MNLIVAFYVAMPVTHLMQTKMLNNLNKMF